MSPPYRVSAASEYELMISAMNVATTAPHPKAKSSWPVGSASSRSSHSSAGSTMHTGTSAKTKPATKPVTPVSVPMSSSTSSRQAAITSTARVTSRMRPMLERAVRRPADGGTVDAADGTVDQPGVEVLMPAEASQARPHLSRPARRERGAAPGPPPVVSSGRGATRAAGAADGTRARAGRLGPVRHRAGRWHGVVADRFVAQRRPRGGRRAAGPGHADRGRRQRVVPPSPPPSPVGWPGEWLPGPHRVDRLRDDRPRPEARRAHRGGGARNGLRAASAR